MTNTLLAWLHRRAENVAAALLAVMFVAFIVQIVFRYALNFPIGWTSELTIICWLWGVLWGAALVVPESGEIRFDILYGAAGRRARRVMGIVAAVALLVLYAVSVKPSWDYVTFMKVQKTAYLKIRFDWLYAVYLLFLVAVLARYTWILWCLIRNREPQFFADSAADPGKVSSGL
jgi:TRAP-type C4-dicarboxylate transport system permease small subunit